MLSNYMIFEQLTVGPFQCNCSIIACETSKEAIVVDPGDEPELILAILKQRQLKPIYLLQTHAHLDHVGASKSVKQHCGGKICLHNEDQFLYDHVAMQAQLFGLPTPDTAPIDLYLKHADTLEFGSFKLNVLHTPGHTPGSLSFYLEGFLERPLLFSGDTLFMGSIGRTDLWGGDYPTIINSIKKQLLTFNDTTLVIPGHGPNTNIGQEKTHNPFLT